MKNFTPETNEGANLGRAGRQWNEVRGKTLLQDGVPVPDIVQGILDNANPVPPNGVYGVSIKESGNVTITLSYSLASHVCVRWWDGSLSIGPIGASKAVPSGTSDWAGAAPKPVYAWPCNGPSDPTLDTNPGTIEQVNVSDMLVFGYADVLSSLVGFFSVETERLINPLPGSIDRASSFKLYVEQGTRDLVLPSTLRPTTLEVGGAGIRNLDLSAIDLSGVFGDLGQRVTGTITFGLNDSSGAAFEIEAFAGTELIFTQRFAVQFTIKDCPNLTTITGLENVVGNNGSPLQVINCDSLTSLAFSAASHAGGAAFEVTGNAALASITVGGFTGTGNGDVAPAQYGGGKFSNNNLSADAIAALFESFGPNAGAAGDNIDVSGNPGAGQPGTSLTWNQIAAIAEDKNYTVIS